MVFTTFGDAITEQTLLARRVSEKGTRTESLYPPGGYLNAHLYNYGHGPFTCCFDPVWGQHAGNHWFAEDYSDEIATAAINTALGTTCFTHLNDE